jgi:aminopeptidase
MDEPLVERLADLVVKLGAAIQPGQDVAIIASLDAAPLVRALATQAYATGARFVDPWYFDPGVKRIRAERAAEETLAYVPPWYGARAHQLGECRGARISIVPYAPPKLLEGLDSARTGKDLLPQVAEINEVIFERTTTWCVVPWPTVAWARIVHPRLADDEALTALTHDLVYVLRLNEDDAIRSWRDRFAELDRVARTLSTARLDALRLQGPGTDLTVGLLPTSRFLSVAGWTNVDSVAFTANLPSEEILTTPDPERADGVVRATKPLELAGTLVEGLTIRFEAGRAIDVQADHGADAIRKCIARDDGAARLGEVALVDRESRVGKTNRMFFETLLDENAASHLALGNAYAFPVSDRDLTRINRSAIHIDFMIGSDAVQVTGLTRKSEEVAVLRNGVWSL